jgi:hypothetical protein
MTPPLILIDTEENIENESNTSILITDVSLSKDNNDKETQENKKDEDIIMIDSVLSKEGEKEKGENKELVKDVVKNKEKDEFKGPTDQEGDKENDNKVERQDSTRAPSISGSYHPQRSF